MKNIIISLFISMFLIGTVYAGPVQQVQLVGNGSSPIYTEANFAPLIFLNSNGGRLVYDDPYGFFYNGNASLRENNYIFTGEQVEWKVLVWDKNGVPEKSGDLFAGWTTQTNGPLDPEIQVNCQYIRPIPSSNLATLGYPNVRRPNDQESQTTGNPQTMGEYLCRLTTESTCHGQKWFGVKITDINGLNGTMKEAESWFCNPSIDLTISGTINFGTLSAGEQGSSTVSIKNSAEEGSGVQVVFAISGSDFYDPSSSGGMCPTSNVLNLQGDGNSFSTGFWYSAVQGSKSSGKKRIPYGRSIVDSDPIFSLPSTNWKNWNEPLVKTSSGSETSLTLSLGLPQPCNGQFTSGEINLWALAI